MDNKEIKFERMRKGGLLWWPLFASILGMLLLLFLLRNCNTPNNFYSNSTKQFIDTVYYNNPIKKYPDKPNILPPIDTSKIIFPDDSLKRPIISNLLNVYLQDTVDLKKFSSKISSDYPKDSIEVTYYADEYKRIQFSLAINKRDQLKKELKKYSEVKFVCYEALISNTNINKNDPDFNKEKYDWFYKKIGLFEAWNTTLGDSSVKIAIIDDSFDPNHLELKNQIEKPWNVYEYSNNINTWKGKLVHGTHVAGTAAGEVNNQFGISGVAPKCKIIPIQIADSQGRMTTSSILDGIFYALKNKADVINMSLGLEMSSKIGNLTEQQQEEYAKKIYADEAKMWNEVYEIAQKENVVIVQAAGNSNVVASLDPMKRSEISIIVGATQKNNNKAIFSNYGQKVDIYAPGVDIYSSFPNNKSEFLDGTSMASPIVAGCVALVKSLNDSISVLELKTLMNETGSNIPNNSGKIIQIDKLILKLN